MSDAGWVITFPNTHHALRGERVAKAEGLQIKMVPVPRYISTDCNVGMEPPEGREEEVLALLQASRVECSLAGRS